MQKSPCQTYSGPSVTLFERPFTNEVRCKSYLSKYSDLVHINEREQARFVLKYIEQDDSLLFLISACRSGDWETFRTRNLEGESLPPTRATLLSHITRANYIAMRDKSYTTHCPVLPHYRQKQVAGGGNSI